MDLFPSVQRQLSATVMSDGRSVKCNCGIAGVTKGALNKSESNFKLGCSFKQELWSMLQNKFLSDVTFMVGLNREQIYAHKIVLAVGSPIFETMFNEKWDSNSSIIEVPDVRPSAFSALLRFIYIDNIEITAESVLEIFYIARKYGVTALENHCLEFLTKCLDASNACSILTQVQCFDEPKLIEACLEEIDGNAERALMSDGFTKIDLAALCSILKRDTLNIAEIEVFEAVLRWSASKCIERNLPVTPTNQKLVLDSALSLVRFPLMTLQEFTSFVLPVELLSDKEVIDLSVHLSNTQQPTGNDVNAIRFFEEEKKYSDTLCPMKNFSSTQFSAKPRLLQIFVKNLDGNTIVMKFRAFDSIRRVKEIIGVTNGWHCISNMCLMWQSSVLENNFFLSDYKIHKDSTIRLISRGRLPLSHNGSVDNFCYSETELGFVQYLVYK